jgi:hypothetical protein
MALRLGGDEGQSVRFTGKTETLVLTVLRVSKRNGVSVDVSGQGMNNLLEQPFTLTIDGLDVKIDT